MGVGRLVRLIRSMFVLREWYVFLSRGISNFYPDASISVLGQDKEQPCQAISGFKSTSINDWKNKTKSDITSSGWVVDTLEANLEPCFPKWIRLHGNMRVSTGLVMAQKVR